MIENMQPRFVTLASQFIEHRDNAVINNNVRRAGFVLVVYHGMRTYYVKHTANLKQYIPSKVRMLTSLDPKLPSALHITESNARSLGQKASIYYLVSPKNLTSFQISEMMAMSGYTHMMTRRARNDTRTRYILTAIMDNDMKIHMSAVESESQNAMVVRLFTILRNTLESNKRHNTAAWGRISLAHRSTDIPTIISQIKVKSSTSFMSDLPVNDIPARIRELNSQAMIEWGNTPFYLR